MASGIRVRIKPNHKPITQFKKVRACQSPNRREYNESNRNGLYSQFYHHCISVVEEDFESPGSDLQSRDPLHDQLSRGQPIIKLRKY